MNRLMLTTALSAVLFNSSLNAQEDPPAAEDLAPWYQIEMVIFAFEEPVTSETLRKSPFDAQNQQTPHSIEATKTFSINELYAPKTEQIDTLATDSMEPDDSARDVMEQATVSDDGLIADNSVEDELAPIEPELLPVEDDQLILAEHALKLKYRRGYKVLWHKAWQQPLPPESEVRDYLITSGVPIIAPEPQAIELNDAIAFEAMMQGFSDASNDVLLDVKPIDQLATDYTRSRFENTSPLFLSEYEQAIAERDQQADFVYQLQGSVQVFRKTFAHLNFDLWFSEIDPAVAPKPLLFVDEHPPEEPEISEASTAEDTQAPLSAADFLASDEQEQALVAEEPLFTKRYEQAYSAQRFGRITESRRIRSGELYYVDHPLFAVVIKMVEVEHPWLRAPTATEDTTAAL